MDRRPSRYHEPAVALPPDARGRTPATAPLRVLPAITGSFRHVVAEGERLDHLAYQYYEEPTSWWQFCDANPEFLSPLALLGQESVGTVRIPIRDPGTGTPTDWATLWATVKRRLAADPALAGIEDVSVDEDIRYVSVRTAVADAALTAPHTAVVEERVQHALVVRFNCTTTALEAVLAAVKVVTGPAGLIVGPPVDIGQLGCEIVIPPLGGG